MTSFFKRKKDQALQAESRASGSDPQRERFDRGIAELRAQPPGDAGARMSPAEIIETAGWMRSAYDQGQLGEVWSRRLALGHLPYSGVDDASAFWINALPALSALRIGITSNAFLASCCAFAERYEDESNAEQRAAVAEFQKLMFG